MYNKTQKYLQEQGANIVKSAENKHYKRINFLTCLALSLISLNAFSKDCGEGHFLPAYWTTGDCEELACKDETLFEAKYRNQLNPDDINVNVPFERIYCPGKKGFTANQSYAQGIYECVADPIQTSYTTGGTVGQNGELVGSEKVFETHGYIHNKANAGHTGCDLDYLECKPGYFYRLKDNTDYCAPCWSKDRNFNFYCPGIKNDYATDKKYWEDGLEKCANNEIPNENYTKCCKCPEGTYVNTELIIPRNKEGYTIGEFEPYTGCFKKNGDNVELVVSMDSFGENCETGQYGFVRTNFSSKSHYYGFSASRLPCTTYDECYKRCPNGSRPSDDLTTCECMYSGKLVTSEDGTQKCENMTIDSEHLKYGPDGRNAKLHKHCWTKTKPADYKKCMLFDK